MKKHDLMQRYVAEVKNGKRKQISIADMIATLGSWGILVNAKEIEQQSSNLGLIKLSKGTYTWIPKKRRKRRH